MFNNCGKIVYIIITLVLVLAIFTISNPYKIKEGFNYRRKRIRDQTYHRILKNKHVLDMILRAHPDMTIPRIHKLQKIVYLMSQKPYWNFKIRPDKTKYIHFNSSFYTLAQRNGIDSIFINRHSNILYNIFIRE